MSGTNSFLNWIHSWQRVPNTLPPILWRASYIAHPLLFSNIGHPLPSPPTSAATVFLLLCFFDWMGDRATLGVLFYLMILWIYTFEPEGSCSWYQPGYWSPLVNHNPAIFSVSQALKKFPQTDKKLMILIIPACCTCSTIILLLISEQPETRLNS